MTTATARPAATVAHQLVAALAAPTATARPGVVLAACPSTGHAVICRGLAPTITSPTADIASVPLGDLSPHHDVIAVYAPVHVTGVTWTDICWPELLAAHPLTRRVLATHARIDPDHRVAVLVLPGDAPSARV